ncbi:hypothetical protein E1B28_010685 [Marasmius oreades]|uniref:Uncharacterized protein n=1 Tax=Marasmius oreades TaxID=181124 RepID=A0A9P7RXS0_9AGAR|nr:uncharacterized protein E1B28_010685 [Marasmius oreades]KAG7091664.1 hypothetical protein E1B28_010685 [Marasmius oreades]
MVFGTITRSPGKRRTKAKGNKCIIIPGHARKRDAALARIAKLLAASNNQVPAVEGYLDTQVASGSLGGVDADMVSASETADVEIDGTVLDNSDNDAPILSDDDTNNTPIPPQNDLYPPPTEDSLRTAIAARLSNAMQVNLRWKQLLPTLLYCENMERTLYFV